MITACTYTYSKTADFIAKTASTVCEVINAVFTAETYQSIIAAHLANSFYKEKDFEDIAQDLFCYLFDQPEKVVDTYNKGELRFFFSGIVKRQLTGKKSKLFGRYVNRQQNEYHLVEEYDETSEETVYNKLSTETDLDQLIDNRDRFNYVINLINANINTSKQLKRNLTIYLMYYVDDLTIQQIADKTTISHSLVFKYLKAARQWVATNVDKSLFTKK